MADHSLDRNVFQEFLGKIKVGDVMKKEVVTLHEDDELSEAQEKFVTFRTSHICIVNNADKLVGLVSQKYLFKTQSPRKVISRDDMDYDPQLIVDGDTFYDRETLDSYILHHVMNKTPFTLTPDDPLTEAVVAMAKKNVGCIPVIDQNRKVKGILTDLVIVRFFASHL